MRVRELEDIFQLSDRGQVEHAGSTDDSNFIDDLLGIAVKNTSVANLTFSYQKRPLRTMSLG